MKPVPTKRNILNIVAVTALVAMIACVGGRAPARAYSTDSNGDVVVFGGHHETIEAGQEVHGDLVVLGGWADVHGKVDGDAVALGGHIEIAPEGHVEGSLVNVGGTIINRSSTPQTNPGPSATPGQNPSEENTESATPWYHDAWTTFFLLDSLLVFITFLLFPARTHTAMDHLADNPLLAGMLGFFSPIIFVLVIIALAITLVGIPLLPLAVLATIAGYLLGKAAIALFIGNRLLDAMKVREPKPIASVALGLGLLFIVSVVANIVIGIIVYFSIGALALGTSLYMLLRTAQAHRRPAVATNVPAPFMPPVDTSHAVTPAPTDQPPAPPAT